MRKIICLSNIFIFILLFSACSNMTIGFEEESIFYTKPEPQQDEMMRQAPVTKEVQAEATLIKSEEKEHNPSLPIVRVKADKNVLKTQTYEAKPKKKTSFINEENLGFEPEEGMKVYYELDDGE